MKNLKKVLCLVLVVALAFSLVTIASAKQASDYQDASAIKNVEAVDVLTGIGVLNGMSSTVFSPASNVTREQAAKIITYMYIGPSAAASLTTAASSFKDVDATRWSSPYIEFCASLGIINGYGNGNFGPTDPVTGLQFAKMLLAAIGYGAKGEYTGDNWKLQVMINAKTQGLFTNNANYDAPATRDDIALYAFNGLFATNVSYVALLDMYIPVTMSSLGAYRTLAQSVFALQSVPQTDKYGYGCYYWTSNGVTVSGNYTSEVSLGKFVGGPAVTYGSLYSGYKWDTTVTQYLNGTSTTQAKTYFAQQGITGQAIANGVSVDLIDTDADGYVDKVIETVPYLAQVTAVNAATGITTVLVYNTSTTDPTVGTAETIYTNAYAVGDFILVTPNTNGYTALADQIYNALDTTKVTANASTMAGYDNTHGNVTFGASTYNLSSMQYLTVAAPTTDWSSSFSYYLANGCVIGIIKNAAAAVTPANYLYVKASQITTGYVAGTSITSATPGVEKVLAYKADGTSVVLTLAADAATSTVKAGSQITIGSTVYSLASGSTVVPGDTWYRYNTLSDGTVQLFALNGTTEFAETSVAVTGGSAAITAAPTAIAPLCTSSTLLNVVKYGVSTSYTGFNSFPAGTTTYAGSTVSNLVLLNSAGTNVTNIVSIDTATASTTTYGVVTFIGSVTASGTTYTVSVAGATASYVSTGTFAVGDVVTVTTASGATTLASYAAKTTAATATAVDPGYVTVGGTTYYFAGSANIYLATTGAAATTASITAGTSKVIFTTNAAGQIANLWIY